MPDTLLGRPVEVLIARDACFEARGDESLDELVSERLVANIERPTDPMKLVFSTLLVFRLLEERQDACIVPALAAALAPAIVVCRGATHVNQAVEGAGAAQHLAARLVGNAIVEAGDRFALEFPIVAGMGEELVIAERYMNPGVAIAPPGLEQQHRVTARLGKPCRHRAARRPRARDDIIESFYRHSVSSPSRRPGQCLRLSRPQNGRRRAVVPERKAPRINA